MSNVKWTRGIGNDATKIFDERGRLVATVCNSADGTTIVRAVNMSSDLADVVEGLRAIQAAVDDANRSWEDVGVLADSISQRLLALMEEIWRR